MRIGGQVDQSAFNGVALGLFYGIVFTFIPLLVLWIGFRRDSWKVWLIYVLVALLLAAPTPHLSIVVGRGNAAHAGGGSSTPRPGTSGRAAVGPSSPPSSWRSPPGS